MILRNLHSAALALPLFLIGCTSLQPELPETTAQRNYSDTLNLDGRLSVRYEGRNGEEALHGNYGWQQRGPDTRITLLSPLGQTMARIEASPAGATLLQSGRPPMSAANVDSLTAQALGWPLPVAGLRDWLQGFAIDAKGQPFVASPAAGSVVTRDGWFIEYPSWTETGNGSVRPRRIDLSRATEQAGKVAIRIVIDNWQTQ